MPTERAIHAVGILALLTGPLLGAPSAMAGPAADQVAAAEKRLQQQPADPAAALQAFDQATDTFWAALPLTFRAITFADAITGFGQFQPRQSAVFKPGEESHIYVALAGYASRPITTGFRVEFMTAVKIKTVAGAILARNDNFGGLLRDTAVESHEFYADLPIPLPDLKPGAYVLEITLRDVVSAKTATSDLPFSIMP
jgi:hypothetical protein